MGDIQDERFAHVARDPKFRRIPKSERKVKIDKRFQSMLKDDRFTVKYTVDKRGRPTNQSSKENLKKYYDLSSEDEDEDEEETNQVEKSKKNKNKYKDGKLKSDDNEKLSKKKKKGKIEMNDKSQKVEETSEESKQKDKSVKAKKSSSKHKNDEEDDGEGGLECSTNGSMIRMKPSLADLSDEISENDYNEEEEEDIEDEDLEDEDEDSEEESEEEKEEQASQAFKENQKQLKLKRKDEEKKLPNAVKKKLRDSRVDYARGEGVLFSDSSSSEEEDDEIADDLDDGDEIVHDWGEFDKDAETTDDVTHRLAVCNMDWDRIRAVDLMVLFSSFLPKGRLINSVTIYPSDFGLQRMKEEEIKGPKELVEIKSTKNSENAEDKQKERDDEEDIEEGSSYHREKMRQYQLNRLKYYYAIVVCDSPESADKIYTECDGTEFELTGAKIDLRFVPDDTTFDQEPREVCTELPDMRKYQPRQFTTTALKQVKVDLTWDETDPNRVEIFEKLNAGKFDEVDDSELRNYLASGSSDEESEEGTNATDSTDKKTKKMSTIEKYKALLKSIEEEEENKKKDKAMEFEITWDMDAKEKAEQLVKDSAKNSESLTPFEKYVEKRKEKKKAKREEKKKLKQKENEGSDEEGSIPSDVDMNDPYFAEEMKSSKKSGKKRKAAEAIEEDPEEERRKAELELLLMDKEEDNRKHFDMKKIEEFESMSKSKKKRLEKKKKTTSLEDDFQVDVRDPRFAALYSSHEYNIDPSDPHYRKTKGTEALVQEKLKKRTEKEDATNSHKEKASKTKMEKNSQKNAELSALVKSVKQKASGFKKK